MLEHPWNPRYSAILKFASENSLGGIERSADNQQATRQNFDLPTQISMKFVAGEAKLKREVLNDYTPRPFLTNGMI